MMGIGPGDAGRLTYWQYVAMRHEWNVRHRLDGDAEDDIEAPDLQFVLERQKELERLGISGSIH